ncbi:MAG: hypothetical protein AAFY17_11905 [Cyanobacteria bacterium J06642_11]
MSNALLSKINGISTLFRAFVVVTIERSVLAVSGLLTQVALGG